MKRKIPSEQTPSLNSKQRDQLGFAPKRAKLLRLGRVADACNSKICSILGSATYQNVKYVMLFVCGGGRMITDWRWNEYVSVAINKRMSSLPLLCIRCIYFRVITWLRQIWLSFEGLCGALGNSCSCELFWELEITLPVPYSNESQAEYLCFVFVF